MTARLRLLRRFRQFGAWVKLPGPTGLLIGAIALGLALTLGLGFVLLQEFIQQERQQVFASVQDTNRKIALSDEVRIRSLLASLDKVLLVLRSDLAQNPHLSLAALMARLDALKVDGELNPRVSVIDASGKVLMSSVISGQALNSQLNVADRAYFQEQKTAREDLLRVGVPVQSRVTGRWIVPITRRITNKDGTFGGLLSMTVDPLLFTEPFADTSFGENATRALMGRDGYTLLRLNGDEVRFGGDTRKSQLYTELKKSTTGCYSAIASSDGVHRSVCYRAIDPYGIIILAGSSVDSIEQLAAAKVRGYIVGAALLGLMVTMLCGLLMLGALRQRMLLKSRQSFNQLIESVPQSIFRLDLQGNVLWANRRTVDYAAPSQKEQARGFEWVMNAWHPDDRVRLQGFIQSALALQPNADFCEYRKRRFDGVYLWHSAQVTRIEDNDGGPDFFLFTGTDIHDRKMAEERTRVAQKLESIGQLTGGMAHDFNNLLAIIVGNLELVKAEPQDSAVPRQLADAINAAYRGVGLVKSLLALASRQPLLPINLNLWALVERIAPLLRHALGPRIEFALEPPLNTVFVQVDESGLEAVLLNLIVNAKDAMPLGGRLTLGLVVAEGTARLSVADTGTGMSDAVLNRATEPFYTTKAQGHGTGLGLSTAAGFAKQSGGRLKIQSTLGTGTVIEICLPLVQTVSADSATLPAARQTLAQRSGQQAKRTILIVDDEPALAEMLQTWAQVAGYTAVVVNSADDALALLAVKAFDVLLSDIMMPGAMDGIDLAKQAAVLYPGMKVVMMSGYSKETATNRSDIPWPLLVKPFREEDFDAACAMTGA